MNLAKNLLKIVSEKKDTVKVQRDLQRRGIQQHLWLTPNPRRTDKILKSAVEYVLSDKEYEQFADVIASVKLPSEYSLSFGKHMKAKKFKSLKSHDYHVLM